MLVLLIIIPAIFALASMLPTVRAAAVMRMASLASFIETALSAVVLFRVVSNGAFVNFTLLRVDALSAFESILCATIFLAASIYSTKYFAEEIKSGIFNDEHARRFGALWCALLGTLQLVFLSENLGLMWIAMETTTLASAFLIYGRGKSSAIEAMWKYLMICSVGIALALVGTMLVAAAARTEANDSLSWTVLLAAAPHLDSRIMLAAFVFILVGFGTKSGLAPMHSWLPDAYGQAPSPVSAVFSAAILNASMYAIMRYIPLVDASVGGGRVRAMLVFFGILSVITAFIRIPAQRDLKRLLAYSSIEHIGVIAFCLGTGGLGTVAALFHMLNHSASKSLAFFSAGRISQECKTLEIPKLHGVIISVPLWGTALFISMLALAGAVPFSIFVSELTALRAAFGKGMYVSAALLLLFLALIFAALMKHAISICLGRKLDIVFSKPTRSEKILVASIVAVMLLLGLFIPTPLWNLLQSAANVVEGIR